MKKLLFILLLLRIIGPVGYITYQYLQHNGITTIPTFLIHVIQKIYFLRMVLALNNLHGKLLKGN